MLKFKKWFAFFLCVVILSSIAIAHQTLSKKAYAEKNNFIINGGFEEPLDENGTISGWRQTGDGGELSLSDQVASSGNTSLQLHDVSSESSLRAVSNRFDVQPNMEYEANASMYVKEQSHSVVFEIGFYDNSGSFLTSERVLYRSSDQDKWLEKWYDIQLHAIAPEGAASAELLFLSGGVSLTEVYFDDVTVEKQEQELDEEPIAIANPGFEDPLADGAINGWNQVGEGGSIRAAAEEKASGEQSLYFHDEDVANTFTVLSDPIEVTPGQTYQADAQMHVLRQTHSVVFELQFFDGEDNLITSSNNLYRPDDSDMWMNQWFDIQVDAPAPVGAEYVRIVFHSGTPSITEVYFDDVSLIKMDTNSDETTTYDQFINPSFEEPLNDDSELVGWDHSDGFSLSTEQALTGDYSLKLEDTSTSSSVWAKSNRIGVQSGTLYKLKANMFVVEQTHSVVFEVSFHDVTGATIGANENVLYRNVEKNTWKDMSLSVEAPANAAYMQVHFRSGGISLTEAYFDDVSFTAVERSMEKPSSMSDEEFFGQWDSDTESWIINGKINYQYSNELDAVEIAVKDGAYDIAAEELLRYYQSRDGYETLASYETKRNSDITALVMDWILTLAGESYASSVTVGNNYETVTGDVTDSVKANRDEGDGVSFILMGRHKGSHAIFHSREADENQPVLEVVADGVTHNKVASKDTYIHAGDTDVNFGNAEQLLVQEEGVPYNDQAKKSYLYFDLSDIDGEITSAKLKLHGVNASDEEASEIMIYYTRNAGWVENELVWSNHYGKTFSYQGEASGTDWQRPPHSDSEYFYQIPRFYFADTLLAEYLATANETYTDHLIDMMMDFIYDTEGYGGQQGAGSFPRTLDSAIRAFNWINAYHELRNTDSLDGAANTEILKTLWKTARFLESEFSDNNWGVIETKGFYHIAGYFPEFQQSPDWELLIHDRLEYLFSSIYKKDGGYQEASTTYASIAINEFLNIKKFGTLNNKSFSEDFDTWLQRAGKYLIDISFPNGIDPIMGDSSNTNHRSVIKELAELTNDPYLLYVGTGGKEGIEPPYTSTLYPIQGTGIMRTGWDAEDLYLHMNTATGSHQHPDELSTIVYGYGRPLIVDPGTFTYSHDDISNWLRKTTEAHNTIEINGKTQDSSLGGEMKQHIQNNSFDFLSGKTFATPGFTHERNIMFVKSGFWIVSDQVTGGTGENRYEQNWHFLPKSNVTIENGSKRASTAFADDGANIQVVPADSDQIEATIEDGYYSEKFYSVEDAKYLKYGKQVEGDASFDTVLYPVQSGDDTEVVVERIPLAVSQDTATALKIEKEMGTDKELGYYYLAYQEIAEREIDMYTFDGKSMYVEETDHKKHKLKHANLIQASKLYREDTPIVEFDQIVEDLSLTWGKRELEISSHDVEANNDLDTATAIYAPRINKVSLNGEEIPFKRRGHYIYAVGLADKIESNVAPDIAIPLDADQSSTITFDLIPSVGDTEGWVRINTGEDCDACTVMGIKLNQDGYLKVVNGGKTEAIVEEAYFANQRIAVRIEVNVEDESYSVYVTPEGKFETQIADNLAFNQSLSESKQSYISTESTSDKDFTIQHLQVDHK